MRFTREKLSRPPVIEVIVTIQADFQEAAALVPGLFYARERERLPTFEEVFLQSPHGLAPTYRFRSEDAAHLVQLGAGFVSLHQMGVYGVYEEFERRVETDLTSAYEVVKPSGLHRVGLRYVNFLADNLVSGEPSQIGLHNPTRQTLPTDPSITSEMTQTRSMFPHDRGNLNVLVAHPREMDGERGTILDLEFVCKWDEDDTSIPAVIKWLSGAHEHVYQAFRASLTPDTYAALQRD